MPLRLRWLKPPPKECFAGVPFHIMVAITDDLGDDTCYFGDEDAAVEFNVVFFGTDGAQVIRCDVQVQVQGQGKGGGYKGCKVPVHGLNHAKANIVLPNQLPGPSYLHAFVKGRNGVLPVLSDELVVSQSTRTVDATKQQDVARQPWCRRWFQLGVTASSAEEVVRVLMREDVTSGTARIALGSHVWDCAIALGDWICSQGCSSWKSKTAVELGSGCGLASIATAAMGGRIVATDIGEEMLDLLQNNISEHEHMFGKNGGKASVCSLDWGEDTWDQIRPQLSVVSHDEDEEGHLTVNVDCILAADVLYNAGSHGVFLETLKSLSSTDTSIFIAYKERWDREEDFLSIAVGEANPFTLVNRIEWTDEVRIFHLKKSASE